LNPNPNLNKVKAFEHFHPCTSNGWGGLFGKKIRLPGLELEQLLTKPLPKKYGPTIGKVIFANFYVSSTKFTGQKNLRWKYS